MLQTINVERKHNETLGEIPVVKNVLRMGCPCVVKMYFTL